MRRIIDSRGVFVRLLRGEVEGGSAAAVRASLAPLGWTYSVLAGARRYAYRLGLLRPRRLGVPVVSVGNITTGGTGKTPFVEWLCRMLLEMDRRPAVLSRGYGPRLSAEMNDETAVLRRHVPNVPVYSDPDRVSAGKRAIAGGADCLVLDDGFQHMRLHRDLDIVLIDALDPFGGGRCLPAGLLREPLSALSEADLFVITRTDLAERERIEEIRGRLNVFNPAAPVAEAVHKIHGFLSPDGTRAGGAEDLHRSKVFLFCGIGNPHAFMGTVESTGCYVVGAHLFGDHFFYTRETVDQLVGEARSLAVDYAVTTEKDAVKMAAHWHGPIPLRVVSAKMDIVNGVEHIREAIERVAV